MAHPCPSVLFILCILFFSVPVLHFYSNHSVIFWQRSRLLSANSVRTWIATLLFRVLQKFYICWLIHWTSSCDISYRLFIHAPFRLLFSFIKVSFCLREYTLSFIHSFIHISQCMSHCSSVADLKSNQAISSATSWAIWLQCLIFIWQWLQSQNSQLKHHLHWCS